MLSPHSITPEFSEGGVGGGGLLIIISLGCTPRANKDSIYLSISVITTFNFQKHFQSRFSPITQLLAVMVKLWKKFLTS